MTDLEAIGAHRAELFSRVEEMLDANRAASKDKSKNQSSLFGGGELKVMTKTKPAAPAWTVRETLANEKEALGFYITGHPLDYFRDSAITAMISHQMESLIELEDKARVRVCGIPQSLEVKMGKSGKRYCNFKIEDRTGAADCVAWQETLNKFETVIASAEPIFVSGKLDKNDDRFVIVIDKIELVTDSVSTIRREE